MKEFYQIDPESVREIEWTGDPQDYDSALYDLGPDDEPFVVLNPWLEDTKPFYYIEQVELGEQCVTYMYEGQWVAKFFPQGWTYDKGYVTEQIEMPRSIWRKNPDLDRTMTFEDDPFNNYVPDPYEAKCELVWYIDPRFNPLEDTVWAMTCRPLGGDVIERREMGYLTPRVDIEINPELSMLKLDLDSLMPAFWEVGNTTVWTLDPMWTDPEQIWAVKITPAYKKPGQWQIKGQVEPVFKTIYNPDLPELDYDVEVDLTWKDLQYCHVWYLDKEYTKFATKPIWAFKIAADKDLPEKNHGFIRPKVYTEYNPDLPSLTYDIKYQCDYYDMGYEHVWTLDPKHTTDLEVPVWAVKIRYMDKPKGQKDMGHISPKFRIIHNPSLPRMAYDLDLAVPYYDLAYEHIYLLDKCHTEGYIDKDIWAVKVKAVKRSKGTKVLGYIKPKMFIEYHNDTSDMQFNLDDLRIPYYDLGYKNVFYLDAEYINNTEHYAIIISYALKTIGSKRLGFIRPITHFRTNPAVKNLKLEFDYQIPYDDRHYKHEWYMRSIHEPDKLIWVARAWLKKDAKSIKDMGVIDVELPQNLDVIFISYDEINAEENWRRVLEKAPWAKRVHGVKGILEAHKEAARQSTTDMFYVVDGDAYLKDEFEFDYQPDIFTRDCVYIYPSINSTTDDTYGYGGVKIFPKDNLLKLNKWTGLDLTTSFSKVVVLEKVSCFSNFAYDDLSAYRSGFREAVKLCWNRFKDPDNPIHQKRLEQWKTKGLSKAHGDMSIAGAWDGEGYFYFYKNKLGNDLTWKALEKINDREYMRQRFIIKFNSK